MDVGLRGFFFFTRLQLKPHSNYVVQISEFQMTANIGDNGRLLGAKTGRRLPRILVDLNHFYMQRDISVEFDKPLAAAITRDFRVSQVSSDNFKCKFWEGGNFSFHLRCCAKHDFHPGQASRAAQCRWLLKKILIRLIRKGERGSGNYHTVRWVNCHFFF